MAVDILHVFSSFNVHRTLIRYSPLYFTGEESEKHRKVFLSNLLRSNN